MLSKKIFYYILAAFIVVGLAFYFYSRNETKTVTPQLKDLTVTPPSGDNGVSVDKTKNNTKDDSGNSSNNAFVGDTKSPSIPSDNATSPKANTESISNTSPNSNTLNSVSDSAANNSTSTSAETSTSADNVQQSQQQLVQTPQAPTLSKDDVTQIVKDTITNNPDIIISSLDTYYKGKIAAEKKQIADKIKSMQSDLENNQSDPRIGNIKNPKVKIVEFFDYSCGYCKRMISVLEDLVKNNPDVVVIFKELPILGDASYNAAKASLAVNIVDKSKYIAYQKAIFNFDGVKNDANLLNLAVSMGIDKDQFTKAYSDGNLDNMLKNNVALAEAIGIKGTPSYIVNLQFVPGMLDLQTFQKIVDSARNSTSASNSSSDSSSDSNSVSPSESNVNTKANKATSPSNNNSATPSAPSLVDGSSSNNKPDLPQIPKLPAPSDNSETTAPSPTQLPDPTKSKVSQN